MDLSEAAKNRIAIAVCAGLVVIMLAPLFRHPFALVGDDPARTHDYLQQATYDRLFRQAVLEDREFPLRTYFLGGGYPLPANPQDSTFSPMSIASLIFGEALGMKINIVLFFCIGSCGMFYLARRAFGASALGAVWAACAYAFSGWWLSRLEWGFYFKLYFHFVPWIWFFLEKARRRALKGKAGRLPDSSVVVAGLLLALTLTQLGLGFVVVALFFLIYFAFDSLAAGKGRQTALCKASMATLAVAFALSALFAAAKLAPMIELLAQSPRRVDNYDIYLGVAGGYPHFYKTFGVFAKALALPSTIPNESIWPGWMTLPLAAAGFAASWKKLWPLFLAALLFALICFGPYCPVDLFKPLWHLPFFRSMHAPYQLFSFFVLAALCLGAARGFDLLGAPELRRAKIALGVIAFATLILGWMLFHVNVLSGIFKYDAPVSAKDINTGPFYAVQGSGMVRGAPRTKKSQQYFNVLRGVGTIDWDGDVLLTEYAQPRYFVDALDRRTENPLYKGEAYFEGGAGEIESLTLQSNVIEVKGRSPSGGLVVVNQNWDRHFTCNYPLIRQAGLLAANVGPGSFELRFSYRPWPMYAGMVCSLICAACALVFLVRERFKNQSGRRGGKAL